mmetsp:Transcript_42468/g.134909  ORF Transcript_42468/g.134909 Transcript_42468/m.134909 type:complete len:476 (+) Transcript_42468:73-1500(+)
MDFDELEELDPVEAVDPCLEERDYGIIVYGATGYTGTLIVEHLDGVLSQPGAKEMKWAISGRNMSGLRRVARKCKTTPGIIACREASDIAKMAGQARVVLAAAGPYCLCGEDVVRECVNQFTHYVDVTGETVWINSMIKKYDAKAKERGVMIVHCSGAICAPDEMLNYTLVQKLGALKQCREYFLQFGGVSGGTFLTNVASMETLTPETLETMKDPFNIGGLRECGRREVDADCSKAEPDPIFPSLWQMPAYNSATGSRIVRRTCQLFEERPSEGIVYGKDFSISIRDVQLTRVAAEQGVQNTALPASAEMAQAGAMFMKASCDRGEQPKPGEGPPPATRAMYFSEVFAVAEGENGEWAHCRYTSGEAYEVTAMASVAAAMVLVEELDRVMPKERGGIVTPAFAMHGSSWIQRVTGTPFAGREGGSRIALELKDGKPEEETLRAAVKGKSKSVLAGQSQLMKGALKGWDRPMLTV